MFESWNTGKQNKTWNYDLIDVSFTTVIKQPDTQTAYFLAILSKRLLIKWLSCTLIPAVLNYYMFPH